MESHAQNSSDPAIKFMEIDTDVPPSATMVNPVLPFDMAAAMEPCRPLEMPFVSRSHDCLYPQTPMPQDWSGSHHNMLDFVNHFSTTAISQYDEAPDQAIVPQAIGDQDNTYNFNSTEMSVQGIGYSQQPSSDLQTTSQSYLSDQGNSISMFSHDSLLQGNMAQNNNLSHQQLFQSVIETRRQQQRLEMRVMQQQLLDVEQQHLLEMQVMEQNLNLLTQPHSARVRRPYSRRSYTAPTLSSTPQFLSVSDGTRCDRVTRPWPLTDLNPENTFIVS